MKAEIKDIGGGVFLMIARGIVVLLLGFALKQYSNLANEVRSIKQDVAVMKGNRFTSDSGRNHDRRITVVEIQVVGMAADVAEIKTDLKKALWDK